MQIKKKLNHNILKRDDYTIAIKNKNFKLFNKCKNIKKETIAHISFTTSLGISYVPL